MSTEHSSWHDISADLVKFPNSAPTARVDVAALASHQGVSPVDNPDVLRGDFWPEDESLDEFLISLRASRSDVVR